RDLLAQDRIDRIHQRARREQDRLAASLALVIGELPDDPCRQQHERQRHCQREQHQAVTDTPAFVWDVQGLLLRAGKYRRGGLAALYPAAVLQWKSATREDDRRRRRNLT